MLMVCLEPSIILEPYFPSNFWHTSKVKTNISRNNLVVHVSGGLGNQMFQYMAGLALAEQTDKELLLNYNWFANPWLSRIPNSARINKRSIGIKEFSKVSETKVDWLPTPRDGRFERIITKLDAHTRRLIGIGGEEDFNGEGWIEGDEIRRLLGVFMSPKYFLKISPQQTFNSLTTRLSSWGGDIIRSVNQAPTIGVHIRLGDYIHLGDILIPHEVYFLNGIELLKEKLQSKVNILVFTDEPSRISERYPVLAKYSNIVSPPLDSSPVENLLALSKCTAFVCSNSSFSWWGSALNGTDPGMIVRPSYFYEAQPDIDVHRDLWAPESINIHPISGNRIA